MQDVTIVEVGPRDGLQNEARVVSPADRARLAAACLDAGLREVEVGSFVSPKWVPRMAGTDAVIAALPEGAARLWTLVPNATGWDAFAAARAASGDGSATPRSDLGVAVFVSATDGFSRANLNCTIDESLARIAPVVDAAVAAGVPVRGYVSCVVDCPFDGPVAPEAVARVVGRLRALAPMQVSLGDTIGAGRPETVQAMLDAVLDLVPATELAGHFHDTGGRALANVEVALMAGLRVFDAAVAGLGGCPYAPGAPGNVATEAVVDRLEALGLATGIDREALGRAAALARRITGKGE